jgi:hypothetical protein
MTNSFNILKSYNRQKFGEIVEFLRIAKLDDLMQKKYLLLYNISTFDEFNDLEETERMELKELFLESNNKILALLDERIKFLSDNKLNSSDDVKDMSENDIIKAILKKIEDLIEYIQIYKGSLKSEFFVLLLNKLLEGLSKLYGWYQNNLIKANFK